VIVADIEMPDEDGYGRGRQPREAIDAALTQ
jgi:hypothetical protein